MTIDLILIKSDERTHCSSINDNESMTFSLIKQIATHSLTPCLSTDGPMERRAAEELPHLGGGAGGPRGAARGPRDEGVLPRAGQERAQRQHERQQRGQVRSVQSSS